MPLKLFHHLAFLTLFVTVTACGQEGLLFSGLDLEPPAAPTTSLSELMSIQSKARKVAKQAQECTVGLVLNNAMGSGVVISEDGYILTAAHVVGAPDQEVIVKFPDGKEVRAISLGMHTTVDGALVKIITDGKWPFMPMIDRDEAPEVGDWCVALGHPQGFRKERTPPVRLGRIIEFTSKVIRSDCTITGGDSGGPLFNLQGQVIGVHSRIAEESTENFHVPAVAMLDAWDRMKEGMLYPDPIHSEFLTILDVDGDGFLTREELTSRYQRTVFDRLVVNFDLATDEPLNIKTIAEDVFHWAEKPQPGLRPLGEELSLTQPLAPSRFIRGEAIQDQFEELVAEPSKVTVRVMDDGIPVGLGVIVREDGLVLAKASSLKSDEISIFLPTGDDLPATIVASDHDYDLALLKAETKKDLETVKWHEGEIDAGSWMIVVNTQGRVGSLGVLAVGPRSIPKVRPVIGVMVVPGGTRIDYVAPKGGAKTAGLEAGDVIMRIDGMDVGSLTDIHELLDEFSAGDRIATVVDRDGQKIETEILLGAREDVFIEMGMGGGHWEMAGPLSRRRDGFPSAIQLDAVVRPSMCGGPVVDAAGNVVGLTLARADRVSTLAVTYQDLRPVLTRLMTTIQAPVEPPVAEKK